MTSTICMHGELGSQSHVFTQSGARTTQACDKHTKTLGVFEISFTEYVKNISLTNFPSHRRRDKQKSHITALELSQRRALNGPLLWLGMQCLPTVVGASVAVDGTNQHVTRSPRSSFSCGGLVHTCWVDRSPRWNSAGRTTGLHRKRRAVARKRIKRVSRILALESSESCGI